MSLKDTLARLKGQYEQRQFLGQVQCPVCQGNGYTAQPTARLRCDVCDGEGGLAKSQTASLTE